ncbi:hypothetical protein CL634_11305 [bacterium]|nr:hypothetical protein [bacterium]
MNKLDLKDITLVCIDDTSTRLAAEIMSRVSEVINFADMKLFSSINEKAVTNKISPINSLTDYSLFAVNELHNYIESEFCMFIQADGYPLNLQAWTDEFLKYDYIGAPWTWVPTQKRLEFCPTGKCVGNGGFSIRSVKLMKEACNYDYDGTDGSGIKRDEDEFICRVIDDKLKAKGIEFAPCELAHYFSIENKIYSGQFGFHGPETLALNKKLGIFKFEEHAYEYMD